MTVRIPGPQPTAGLDSLLLGPTPGGVPLDYDTGTVIASTTGGALDYLRTGSIDPNVAPLDDDHDYTTEVSAIALDAKAQADTAATGAAEAKAQTEDRISPNFAGVDNTIDGAGSGIANVHLASGGASDTETTGGDTDQSGNDRQSSV